MTKNMMLNETVNAAAMAAYAAVMADRSKGEVVDWYMEETSYNQELHEEIARAAAEEAALAKQREMEEEDRFLDSIWKGRRCYGRRM